MNNSYTELDVSDFGMRELHMLKDLLAALRYSNKTERFELPVKSIGFNHNSGNVFLIDENYNVDMDSNGELFDFLSCPECGNEGLANGDFTAEEKCCKEYLGEE